MEKNLSHCFLCILEWLIHLLGRGLLYKLGVYVYLENKVINISQGGVFL